MHPPQLTTLPMAAMLSLKGWYSSCSNQGRHSGWWGAMLSAKKTTYIKPADYCLRGTHLDGLRGHCYLLPHLLLQLGWQVDHLSQPVPAGY